jgi:hypothetical protein
VASRSHQPLTSANTLAVVLVHVTTQSLISASPNPIPVPPGVQLGMTDIQWNAPSAQLVEIHVGAPDGPLFAKGGSSGSAETGEWVGSGTWFYLQDVTGGSPGNTLDQVLVTLQQQAAVFTANPNPIPQPLIGATTVSWNAPTATAVEIHIGSPSGTLFAAGGSVGSAVTGDWVTEGLIFFLQDVTDGKPLTPDNTLASFIAHVGQSTYFSASPNPVSNWVLVNGVPTGSTTLLWNVPFGFVQIYAGSPAGPVLIVPTAPNQGSVETGPIVTDGQAFYLDWYTNGPAGGPTSTTLLIAHLTPQAAPTLIADPNPASSQGTGLATTTLTWNAPAATSVEIHVGAPNGPLFTSGGNSGSATTGNWITNGELFYLQDVSGGKPLTSANTLAVAVVTLSN